MSSKVSWATVSLLPSQHPPIIALTRLNRQDPLGALGPAVGLFCHQGLPLEPFFIRQAKPNSTPLNDLFPSKTSAYNSVLEAQIQSARQIVNSGSWPGLHHDMSAQIFILQGTVIQLLHLQNLLKWGRVMPGGSCLQSP